MKILESWKGARFVGLYICFPTEANNRRIEILRQVLGLEPSLDFNKMKFGLLMEKIRETSFDQSQLPEILASLEHGSADWLQLYFERADKDWVRAYDEHIELSWESLIQKALKRPLSPIEQRFGRSIGTLKVAYPLSRFAVGTESDFQKQLLALIKFLTSKNDLYWSFIHEGFRPKRPASVGADSIFLETHEKFPLTSFDADLSGAGAIYFKEFVKGAFWANFLNPFHVEQLGGIRRIEAEHPSSIFEKIEGGRVSLQVGPSPLPRYPESVMHDYQRLRKFLKPILLETPDERQKLQMKVLGSWRPPGYDVNWKPISSTTPADNPP